MGSLDPVLLIVGRTRIGKGEFISTANRILQGSALPNIVSDGLNSHTKEARGYSMRFGKRAVRMVDTVGFDDSGGTDIPERTLLQFLAGTGKADLYPPIVIIQTLSALEKDLLQKMSVVFPRIVVALRSENRSTLDRARSEINSECTKEPVAIFHLQGFVSKILDDGKTRRLYDDAVSDIVRFYETLIPSREELDFNSPLFAGKYERTPGPKETKSEIINDSYIEVTTGKSTVVVPVVEVDEKDAKSYSMIRCFVTGTGAAIAGAGAITAMAAPGVGIVFTLFGTAYAITGATLGRTVDLRFEDLQKEFKVNFIVTEKIRKTFEREVTEVWKVLAGDIKIFVDHEYGSWEKVGDDELVKRSHHKVDLLART